jgi:hypothetical protein
MSDKDSDRVLTLAGQAVYSYFGKVRLH